jgi:hypothetical protein
LVFSATCPWGRPPEADKFCPLRIASLNRDLRDIVDFVDVFPFLNHEDTKNTPVEYASLSFGIQRGEAKYILYVRRVKRRTYIVLPKGQSLLCVPCGFVVYCKQRGILKIAVFFNGLREYMGKNQTSN